MSRFFPSNAWLAGALIAVAAATSFAQADEPLRALHFSGEPVGDEPELSYHLDADARTLLAREPKLAAATSLDDTAASLQRGDRIRAFAEALAVEASTDATVRARSHVRRAWILAELGAINYGAEHANEALTTLAASPAALGELHLARAWLLWRAGNFDNADREAARAAGTKPAAPAWALAAWKKHRADHTTAAEAFTKLSEPDDSTTPEFLAYANAARAAGALNVADEAYFSALNQLQQERNALPATPPDRLFRAALAHRDFLLSVLGAPSPATVGPRLWSSAVSASRSAAVIQPDRAAWEKYFSLLYVAQTAVPGFDFTDYDLAGDLALAEQGAKLAPVWRDRLAALLARPDLRYASRELQAARRLEDHPAFQFQFRDLDATYAPDELAQLEEFAQLHATEIGALKNLRAQLPPDTPPGTRDLFFTRVGLTQTIRLAAAKRDLDAARKNVRALQAVRTRDDQPVPEAAELARALLALERQEFYTAVAELAFIPAVLLDEDDVLALHLQAARFSDELAERVGDDYDTRFNLAPDDLLLAHHLTHVRFLDALIDEELLVICDRFNDLEARVTRTGVPAYPHLERARTVLKQIPADTMKASPAERELVDHLRANQEATADTLKQAQAFVDAAPDKLLPPLLLALTHWRLGHEDDAVGLIAKLRQRARAHPPTLDQIAQIERNNSTTLIMQDHLAKLGAATPATHDEILKRARADANLMATRLRRGHGGKIIDATQMPPAAREAYAHVVTVIALTRLPEGRLIYPASALELLREQNRRELLARLEPAFVAAPFTHDLPDADAIAVWRDLLLAAPLDNPTSTALAKRATAFEANSVSIRVASTAIGLRRSSWLQSRDFVADLRTEFGTNRALARQLDALDAAIKDCLALDRTPTNPELDRRRQAHLNDKNRAEAERRRMAVSWHQAPEAFKENWDLTNDRRTFQQLGEEMNFHQQKIDAIDAEKAASAGIPAQAIQNRLAQLFRELTTLAGL